MTPEELAIRHPQLYHVTEPGAWLNIMFSGSSFLGIENDLLKGYDSSIGSPITLRNIPSYPILFPYLSIWPAISAFPLV